MEAILNFRDFGGYRTRDGQTMKTGLLFRSGSLSNATDHDQQHLLALGIKTVIDLRTHRERQKWPERLPGQIVSVHIPIKSSKHNESGFLLQLGSVLFGRARKIDFHELMRAIYREYVTHFRKEFAQILRLLAEPSNLPVLIHCVGGKDRTGFACWLIHLLLGVPEETALEDYLKTNDQGLKSDPNIQRWIRILHFFDIAPNKFLPLFEARTEYLMAAQEQIIESFGTVENFVKNGLNFFTEQIDALKNSLLQD